jgi:hypothetical protein
MPKNFISGLKAVSVLPNFIWSFSTALSCLVWNDTALVFSMFCKIFKLFFGDIVYH